MSRRVVVVVGILTLAACSNDSSGPIDPANVPRVNGRMEVGFEVSSFRPCGSNELWWVEPADVEVSQELHRRIEQVGSGDSYESVFVRFRGDTSSLGSYGHLGAYQRQFSLTAIYTVQDTTFASCS